MITLAFVLAYLTASLYGARRLYGRLRARAVDKAAAEYPYRNPINEFNKWDRGPTAFVSTVLALFWPLALARFGVYQFVTSSPELSHAEAAAERKAMAQRIRELEHELGIKEQP
ncbi:hypothetical protein [Streptomyces ossamyceticus]|uniref:hypothetical protein n=1 Tax=Streptomyces ossamyceticus TaxID=249581 RepID=UPI003427AAAB